MVLTRVRKLPWNCIRPSFPFQTAPETWPEEAQCSGGPLWMVASRLLPRDSSDWWFYSSRLITNLPVYQYAKSGAPNPRINWIRSDKICFPPLLQVLTPRFYVPTIFWLSNLVAMFPRASGILMGSSLHAFSHSYASWLRVMEQAQTETQNGKFH